MKISRMVGIALGMHLLLWSGCRQEETGAGAAAELDPAEPPAPAVGGPAGPDSVGVTVDTQRLPAEPRDG